MTMIDIATTRPANRVIAEDSTMGSAPGTSTLIAAAVSISKTTTGKTPAATNIGWATKATTSRPTAMATKAPIAVLTVNTTAAAIVMTTAIATVTIGANPQDAGCPISRALFAREVGILTRAQIPRGLRSD